MLDGTQNQVGWTETFLSWCRDGLFVLFWAKNQKEFFLRRKKMYGLGLRNGSGTWFRVDF